MHSKWFYAIVVGAFALSTSWAARAADVAVLKAPPAYPYQTSGFYLGIHTSADVAQTSVSGTNLFATSLVQGNLTAAGGEVGIAAGWIKGSIATDNWWGLDGECSYQNVTGSLAVAGASISAASRWNCMGTVEVSTSFIKTIAAALPNLGLQGFTGAFPGFTPVAPPGVSVAAPHEFFGGGFRAQGLSGSFGDVGGSNWSIAPQIRYGAIWETLNAAGKPTGSAVKAYAWTAFPSKGVEFNGLFGPGNPTIGSGAGLAQQYGIALDVLFGG